VLQVRPDAGPRPRPVAAHRDRLVLLLVVDADAVVEPVDDLAGREGVATRLPLEQSHWPQRRRTRATTSLGLPDFSPEPGLERALVPIIGRRRP
jgi:hypothetical protein